MVHLRASGAPAQSEVHCLSFKIRRTGFAVGRLCTEGYMLRSHWRACCLGACRPDAPGAPGAPRLPTRAPGGCWHRATPWRAGRPQASLSLGSMRRARQAEKRAHRNPFQSLPVTPEPPLELLRCHVALDIAQEAHASHAAILRPVECHCLCACSLHILSVCFNTVSACFDCLGRAVGQASTPLTLAELLVLRPDSRSRACQYVSALGVPPHGKLLHEHACALTALRRAYVPLARTSCLPCGVLHKHPL